MTEWEEIYAMERTVELSKFRADDAWKLGCMLVKWGQKHKKEMVIRISVNHHLLFHYAFDGTSVENDSWAQRKENMVYYTGHSSYATALYLQHKGETPTERYGLLAVQAAASGGEMPIRLQGAGVIGVLTVSGMSQQEDHALVFSMLKAYQENI